MQDVGAWGNWLVYQGPNSLGEGAVSQVRSSNSVLESKYMDSLVFVDDGWQSLNFLL